MRDPKPPRTLLAEMADALASADDAVREAWERIRIDPELWRSPAGEQVWALAVSGADVWWFDEAEEWFGRSPFAIHGLVCELGGSVQEFAEVLASLPEAEKAEVFARAEPAFAIPPALHGPGTIGRRQTTSWELRPAAGGTVRVHFTAKQEARYGEAAYDHVTLVDRHPLLADFEQTWAEVYVVHAQRIGPRLVAELTRRVEVATDGWRSAGEYLSRGGRGVLEAGHGLLLRAPETVARIAAEVIAEAGAEASVVHGRGERRATARMRALLLGRTFVVAEAFRFVRVG